MASENTHIYLADRIRGEIDDDVLKRFISGHADYYFLGAIFPDILFYSKVKRIIDVAYNLHGEDGLPTRLFLICWTGSNLKKTRKIFRLSRAF